MDAKFTILTNSTKGVIEYQNGAIFSIKIKFLLSNEESVRFDASLHGSIFPFPHKLVIQEQYEYNNKEKRYKLPNGKANI
jgi:hypothetical protein